MKIVAVVVLLLLWVCVLCGPVNYNSFLARLSPKKSYQQYSLLEELDYSVPHSIKEQHEMEYEIARAFVIQHFYRSELPLSEIKKVFDDFFPKFKMRWLTNMQDTIIRELGLDTSNEAYLSEIKTHPERYSINYETFKILTYKI